MNTINESSNTDKKGDTHGISREGFASQTPQNTHNGNSFKRETPIYFPKARCPYGSFKAPVPQVFQSVQEKSKLGQEAVHVERKNSMKSIFEDDERYINNIKRPLLENHPVPVAIKSNCCCC
jgi:hypothetical protein